MRVVYLVVLFWTFVISLLAKGADNIVISKDFNNDSLVDSLVYDPSSGVSVFYISNINKSENVITSDFIKNIHDFNNLDIENTFVDVNIDEENQITFEIEMTGRGEYYESFCFIYNVNNINLIKIESSSINKNDFDGFSQKCQYVPVDPIKIELFDYKLINSIFHDEKKCTNRFLIKRSFEEIYDRVKIKKTIEYPTYDRLAYYLNEYRLASNTLRQYNDIAYYLEQGESFKESLYILQKIIEEFPNRTVAYINLGDAYWGLDNKDKAKEAYEKYILLMKSNGKQSKIPQQIYDRVK